MTFSLASQLEFYNFLELKYFKIEIIFFFLLKISVAILISLINKILFPWRNIISKTKFSKMFLPKSREFPFYYDINFVKFKKIQNDLYIKLKLNRKIRNII